MHVDRQNNMLLNQTINWVEFTC